MPRDQPVKERPILFQGDLVRAILAGTKTVTRRPVKPQVARVVTWALLNDGTWEPIGRDSNSAVDQARGRSIRCPYGLPGDRLWCRETWAAYTKRSPESGECDLIECAPSDMPEQYGTNSSDVVYKADKKNFPERWRTSIHMPRWASRILLEVVDVRVERLQSITEDDVYAEGVTIPVSTDGCEPGTARVLTSITGKHPSYEYLSKNPTGEDLVRAHFASKWDDIYSADDALRWKVNPWCWRIAFKRPEATP